MFLNSVLQTRHYCDWSSGLNSAIVLTYKISITVEGMGKLKSCLTQTTFHVFSLLPSCVYSLLFSPYFFWSSNPFSSRSSSSPFPLSEQVQSPYETRVRINLPSGLPPPSIGHQETSTLYIIAAVQQLTERWCVRLTICPYLYHKIKFKLGRPKTKTVIKINDTIFTRM